MARRRFDMRFRFHWQHIREYIFASFALTGYDALALLMGQADVLLLMFILGPFYVGLYVLAIRISDPLLSITAIYINGVYPLLCIAFERRRERFAEFYREMVRIIALAVIPPSVVVSLLAGTVVGLLGGKYFVMAIIVVQLLMWATAIICFSQLTARSCMAANLERFIPYVSGISALCNIVGNLLLISRWQVMGAGVVSITSELVALVLFTILLRKYIQPWRTLGVVARVGLAMLPTVAFLLWQPHLPLLVTIALACILIVCGCYITRTLRWRDITIVWRFLIIF
jgi:O-antigen/teichoic acid export membrane protein